MAATAAVTLTACEKPKPGVSVFSGSRSVHTEALCWAFDTEQLAPGQCAQEVLTGTQRDGVTTLEIDGGNTIGFSVDPTVAETGWRVVFGSEGQTPQTTSTYLRFPLGPFVEEDVPIQIVAGSGEQPRGIWLVRLVPAQQ